MNRFFNKQNNRFGKIIKNLQEKDSFYFMGSDEIIRVMTMNKNFNVEYYRCEVLEKEFV